MRAPSGNCQKIFKKIFREGTGNKLFFRGVWIDLQGRSLPFARIHQIFRVTPAMEAGVTHHVWTLEEIAALGVKEVMLLDTNQKVIQWGPKQYFSPH
jgi:hypothetical protein